MILKIGNSSSTEKEIINYDSLETLDSNELKIVKCLAILSFSFLQCSWQITYMSELQIIAFYKLL